MAKGQAQKVTTKPVVNPVTDPMGADDVPQKLKDDRPLKEKIKDKIDHAVDALEESKSVDHATNVAAEAVRTYGNRNTKKLAKKIEVWVDTILESKGGFAGKLFRKLPIAGLLTKQINSLVDVIAEWLEEFSDASEDDEETDNA